jgi:hypothetical protein
MTAYHIRESQGRIVALCVAFVDPLAFVVAGLWLALQLRPIAESWVQHHPLHYLAWAVALYAGIVLIVANAMVPLSLLARGLGISKEVFRDVRPSGNGRLELTPFRHRGFDPRRASRCPLFCSCLLARS